MTVYNMDSDDPLELGEPLRCAVCLAQAVHDARIGTTSRAGHIAVTVAEGTALCFAHFERRDLRPLWYAS